MRRQTRKKRRGALEERRCSPYFSTKAEKIDKDPAELLLVENKIILKMATRCKKYCNACRAEKGRFPTKIDAQCRNFKFWLYLL